MPWIIWWAWFYNNIILELPDIAEIEEIQFSETSKIVDRNWIVLYKLYEENRSYVSFDEISDDMINAIISVEDQNFWNNPWIDIRWIIRAWIHDITNLWQDLQGGSTLTQQLIKNLLLTPEQTIERKLQEIVLAIKLNWHLKEQIIESHWQMDEELLDRKVKEKILELYLNYVFLWNNAYWVEAASQTYFWKSANELDILQSSIIASLPRSPWAVNPYNNTHRLMWQIVIEDSNWNIVPNEWEILNIAIEWIEERLNNSSVTFYQDTNRLIEFLRWLLDFSETYEWESYNISYNPWRKDLVLARMYADWYISQEELKKSIIEWFNYPFKQRRTDIKAPHFVFEIVRQLEENYPLEALKRWWLTIRTSLDYEIQQKAKKSIKDNMDYIEERWWNNSAMIYVDTRNWDILAYVWSKDYFNQEIDWNVDIIRSNRQPWSALKPLVYAKWIQREWLTPDTPVYDIPMEIWDDEPVNSDWQFMWLIPLKYALAHSRNIPAIKMYFAAWQESAVKNFFWDLWFTTFREDTDYWYPIALGWWEVKMYELAKAYSHLTADWNPAKINPILEITWADWQIMYRKTVEHKEQVISNWVAYIIWEILSNPDNMPSSWRNNFAFNWIDFWIKSWTSNIRESDWRRLPRDWWLVSYTPSSVAIFWAWNTRWEALQSWAYWWWLNAGSWREFFWQLRDEWIIENEEISPSEIRNISISEISWNRASWSTPLALINNTVWYINNMPSDDDESIETVQIDSMCDWKVSNLTPSSAIDTAYIIEPSTIMPNDRDIDDIIEWRENRWKEEYSERLWNKVLLEEPNEACEERERIQEEWTISLELVNPENWQNINKNFSIWYNISSPFNIENISVEMDWNQIYSHNYSSNRQSVSDIQNINLDDSIQYWNKEINITVRDSEWYTDNQTIDINLIEENNTTPYLSNTRSRVTQNENDEYQYVLLFRDDTSYVEWWTILKDWEIIYEFDWNLANFSVDNNEWIQYEIYDIDWNIWEWIIDL